MNTIGYFEIQSSEPEREIDFYANVFGWNFFKEESIPIEYYRIETNSVNGGLLKRPAKVSSGESGTNAFVCSMQVENFDKTSELIIQNAGQVSLSKFAIPVNAGKDILLIRIITRLGFLKLMRKRDDLNCIH